MANVSDTLPAQILNPFTPMAFLPPDVAYEKTVTVYVLVGVFGVLAWDILTHLGADYKLLTRYKINIPTLIYFLSRWSTLLQALLNVVFQTAQIENCVVFAKFACALYHPAVSATALLFFFRVRAIYDGNKYITAVFFVMWLAVVGTSVTAIPSLTGVRIGNTKYCITSGFKPYISSSNIVIATFDTCVFLAISWRLLANAPSTSEMGRSGKFGKYLPRFSRALFQDGQNYYMVAIVCNLLLVIMTYAHGVPIEYRSLFLVPSTCLTNIMACRVFRHTKLGNRSEENAGTLSTMFRQSRHTDPIFIHARSTTHSTATDTDVRTANVSDTDVTSSGNSAEKLPQLSKEFSV